MTRNALPSNQMRSQADQLLCPVLEGNKLSNGKEILLNENSFFTFLITYWSTLVLLQYVLQAEVCNREGKMTRCVKKMPVMESDRNVMKNEKSWIN